MEAPTTPLERDPTTSQIVPPAPVLEEPSEQPSKVPKTVICIVIVGVFVVGVGTLGVWLSQKEDGSSIFPAKPLNGESQQEGISPEQPITAPEEIIVEKAPFSCGKANLTNNVFTTQYFTLQLSEDMREIWINTEFENIPCSAMFNSSDQSHRSFVIGWYDTMEDFREDLAVGGSSSVETRELMVETEFVGLGGYSGKKFVHKQIFPPPPGAAASFKQYDYDTIYVFEGPTITVKIVFSTQSFEELSRAEIEKNLDRFDSAADGVLSELEFISN